MRCTNENEEGKRKAGEHAHTEITNSLEESSDFFVTNYFTVEKTYHEL